MRVFISWSGARSNAVAATLRDWLPKWVPGIDLFHSEDIPKGRNWYSALVEALRDCRVGIFCATPEGLRSPWLLFEAGAMAQHGEHPTLLTYVYGMQQIDGPLGHFQATRFEQADTRRLIAELLTMSGETADATATDRFNQDWPAFRAQVMATTAVPVQELLSEFSALFDQRKTFHESFPDCSNKRWDDRLRRTARTHAYLSQPAIAEIFQSDAFLRQGYAALLTALDRYDMHIGSYLLDRRDYSKLDEAARRALEDARLLVLDAVATLRRKRPVPILTESPAFETEPSADARKAQIHAIEDRVRRDDLPLGALRERPEWALDRIAYYLAFGAGRLPEVGLDDLVAALKSEEENARTRSLVTGLQPLYYAVECIDERLTSRPDARTAARLTEAVGEVQRFVDAHPGRDAGGHIARRIASIRQKIVAQ